MTELHPGRLAPESSAAAPAPQLFALGPGRELAERVAALLGLSLGRIEERSFEDGEHKSRPLESVRERDVYVLQSVHSDASASVNDLLCRLLFFIGAVKDAGARRVTAVVPYLGYARKDQKSKPRDPTTTRYVASFFEAVGTDRIVTLDVHNPAAFQNAFRCATEHLEATGLFASYFARRFGASELVVVSPDIGGVKRAEKLRAALSRMLGRELPLAFVEKWRSEGKVGGGALAGEVQGRVAILLDDIIGAGTTMLRAAQSCRTAGALEVHAAATHGVFTGEANRLLADEALGSILVSDSLPPWRLQAEAVRRKLATLEIAPLLAEAVRRLHQGGSLIDLLAG